MKRCVFNPKLGTYVYTDWIPNVIETFGDSCVKKSKYVSDTVRINNNEVSTGNTRTALYTMPGGIDNGVRYSALYETSGLDITEIEANKRILEAAKDKVEDSIKEEIDKISAETANRISMKAQKQNVNTSGTSAE